MHFLDGAAYALVHRNLFFGVEQIFDCVVRVSVAGHKINRDILLHTWARKASIQSAAAVEGPPTRSSGDTDFRARAV